MFYSLWILTQFQFHLFHFQLLICKCLFNRCSCPSGFKGKICDELEYCAMYQCPAGGICQNLIDGYECLVNATFNGNESELYYKARLGNISAFYNFSTKYRSKVSDASNLIKIMYTFCLYTACIMYIILYLYTFRFIYFCSLKLLSRDLLNSLYCIPGWWNSYGSECAGSKRLGWHWARSCSGTTSEWFNNHNSFYQSQYPWWWMASSFRYLWFEWFTSMYIWLEWFTSMYI